VRCNEQRDQYHDRRVGDAACAIFCTLSDEPRVPLGA
jgi:hypothetical protein